MAVFDRGDIVTVPHGPGHRPCAARHAAGAGSDDEGVQQTRGDVLIAPITQGGDLARNAGFAVSLTGTAARHQQDCLARVFDEGRETLNQSLVGEGEASPSP